eukprot:CAMPEP_0198235850 /NCGR_PEP_ID=MMETSP1446-20131203/1725_1 /TAXON_ID=1461542 ORGANISM="Unidentified sp, Strain CCMP2111" /NCGR_SAMPLE_ID=MMETSP1446 /ASSEMBLY_ACC=CAM_ASM_001112 /LENGTH=537 /DNA_ID=CAMNT_0043917239 /DNA_START=83 /DNA_END=1696 /DNA_ORIENTATION=+
MPRDMSGTGRYPPTPKHAPFAFYSCIRLGDPEQLAKVMDVDPYFWTQDNGAGAPIHFATTYKQLDMIHHILNNGGAVNQRDKKGFTALHRAAYLSHYEGYLEIYEYLLSRGADPSIRTEDYDPYLNPGKKVPMDLCIDDKEVRAKLKALEDKYKGTKKEKEPHPDIGDWWTLYDYGLDAVLKWDKAHKPNYPEEMKRRMDDEDRKREKKERKARQLEMAATGKKPAAVKKTPVAFLFPGQGSQSVGMPKDCLDVPKVKEMFAKAEQVLGYDLLSVCQNGPKSKLDNTIYSQPALFVCSLAAVEKLRQEDAATVESASCTAGLSLGEYTALVFAGALSFEDALKIVKVRAESMAKAAEQGEPHGMLSIVGLADAAINDICMQVKQKQGGDVVCQMANYLFPQGRVVSGHKKALAAVQELATRNGALKAQEVAVSGAFHTSLMGSAGEALANVLKDVTFSDPRIPVYSNVTGMPFKSKDEIPELLKRQLCEPVRWEDTVKAMIESGKTQMHELGPGKQIKAMVKRINNNCWKNFQNVTV